MQKHLIILILAAMTCTSVFIALQEAEKSKGLAAKDRENNLKIEVLEEKNQSLTEALEVVSQPSKAREEHATSLSPADQRKVAESCRSWIGREFGFSTSDARVVDSWEKDGRLVFEIGTPVTYGGSPRLFLCVYDEAKKQMFKPGAFETASWRIQR